MSGTTYVQRQLSCTITRAKGTFSGEDGNTVTLDGMRMIATVTKHGGPSFNELMLRVFGLRPSLMNDLSTLGQVVLQDQRNTISLYAGDAESGQSLVFAGTIYAALASFRDMPNVSFTMQAQAGLYDAIAPIAPTSYQGGVDIVTLMSGFAQQMGLVFENNGVSGIKLQNPYYPGSARQQAYEAADHAGIAMVIDDNTLAIWPAFGQRGGVIPLISPDTGLIGYPEYTANGLDIVTLYNPSIRFGAQVQLQSSLPQANGTWSVYGLVHNLASMTPNGNWFTAVRLVQPGYAPLRS